MEKKEKIKEILKDVALDPNGYPDYLKKFLESLLSYDNLSTKQSAVVDYYWYYLEGKKLADGMSFQDHYFMDEEKD